MEHSNLDNAISGERERRGRMRRIIHSCLSHVRATVATRAAVHPAVSVRAAGALGRRRRAASRARGRQTLVVCKVLEEARLRLVLVVEEDLENLAADVVGQFLPLASPTRQLT